MNKDIERFMNYLRKQVETHAIYVLGGQGELIVDILPRLTSMETEQRVDEILTLISQDLKAYSKAGTFDLMYSRAFDCSGLGTYFFLLYDLIENDMTAAGLYKQCTPISEQELREGDLVFQAYSSGEIHHVGYYTGNGNITEAKGRKWGVVETSYKRGGWTHCGRPKFWKAEKVLTRYLKYVPDNLMTGSDVKMVQEQLQSMGYPCGKPDGEFGKKTDKAVRELQANFGLKVDGIVGEKTAKALDIEWSA